MPDNGSSMTFIFGGLIINKFCFSKVHDLERYSLGHACLMRSTYDLDSHLIVVYGVNDDNDDRDERIHGNDANAPAAAHRPIWSTYFPISPSPTPLVVCVDTRCGRCDVVRNCPRASRHLARPRPTALRLDVTGPKDRIHLGCRSRHPEASVHSRVCNNSCRLLFVLGGRAVVETRRKVSYQKVN